MRIAEGLLDSFDTHADAKMPTNVTSECFYIMQMLQANVSEANIATATVCKVNP